MLNSRILGELQAIVGRQGLLSSPSQLLVYEYDASMDQHVPDVVVLPAHFASPAELDRRGVVERRLGDIRAASPELALPTEAAFVEAMRRAVKAPPDVYGKIIAANGDEIFFDSPTTVLQGIITGGTGRFAGASGEFNIVELEQTGMEPGTEPGTVKLSFVWSAAGTITY